MPKAIPTFRHPWQEAAAEAARRAYERAPGRRADKAFYKGPAWRRLRALVLAEEPLCRRCRERHGRLTPADHVDHILPRRERPDLALDRGNLRPLCRCCHVGIRAEQRGPAGGRRPG